MAGMMSTLVLLGLLAVVRGQVCDGQHQPCGSIQCSNDQTKSTMSGMCGWADSCCQCCTSGHSTPVPLPSPDPTPSTNPPEPEPSYDPKNYPEGTFCAIISDTLADVMTDLGCGCAERTDGLGVRSCHETCPESSTGALTFFLCGCRLS